MSREVVIVKHCDQCEPGWDREVVASWDVAIGPEGSKPATVTIDTCKEHAALWETCQERAAQVARHGTGPVLLASAPPRVRRDRRMTCDLCQAVLANHGGLLAHVKRAHIPGYRPPTTCPECGQVYDTPQQLGPHRSSMHGADVLTELYARARGVLS